MSKLSHAFSVEHAQIYGIECAILISHFQFWIEQNQRLNRNNHENKTWMFQTQKEIAACYPYWNRDQIQYLLKKLVDFGVLITGNFNKKGFDRTQWYAFKDESKFLTKTTENKQDNKENSNNVYDCGKVHNRMWKSAQAIPNTKQDTYKRKNNNNKKEKTRPPAAPSPVVVSSKKIYNCLENIDIKLSLKERLTKKYSEEVVINAIAYVEANRDKITKSYSAYLSYACEECLKIEDLEDYYSFCKEFDGKYNSNGVKIQVFKDKVLFISDSQKKFIEMKFNEKKFRFEFLERLKKYEFI